MIRSRILTTFTTERNRVK